MSPEVAKNMGGFRRSLVCAVVFVAFTACTDAKPTNDKQDQPVSSARPLARPSQPVYSPRSTLGSGRKVLTSWNEDGSWQASARLPTSLQKGGNDQSRYNIRRDGSLSVALQVPQSLSYKRSKLSPLRRIRSHQREKSIDRSQRSREPKQYSPNELRSFSVIISDVDVVGDYTKTKAQSSVSDAYSKAGVDSYHIKSNSIHRMNASWKLKPGHASPTSSELLDFLSYFANNDGRAIRSDNPFVNEGKPFRKILGQETRGESEKAGSQISHALETDESKQPFLTWQESSRKIPVTEASMDETTTIATTTSDTENDDFSTKSPIQTSSVESLVGSPTDIENDNMNSSNTSSNESKVVLHELISTLKKLNDEKEEIENESGTSLGKDDMNETHSLRANQTKLFNNGGSTAVADSESHQDARDKSAYALGHYLHDIKIDQTTTHEYPEQVQRDGEMETPSNSSKQEKENENNKGEKEGDVFVQNESARVSVSLNSHLKNKINNTTAAYTYNEQQHEHSRHHDDGALVDGMKKRKRTPKSSVFDSSKSTNANGKDKNNTASTSATYSDEIDELRDASISKQRMKITDPQQTASDLKKLMSLILKSDGNKVTGAGGSTGNGGIDSKSGTQVVNIVITPNQQDHLESSPLNPNHPEIKNSPQKILFLKTPQVKQMLDMALTDPALSSAAQKIAAALETNSYPNPIPANTNIDHMYEYTPGNNVKSSLNMDEDEGTKSDYNFDKMNQDHEYNSDDNMTAAPNGFPMSGNGFLNVHHPNLQFHQALHKMVVNGSLPTTINATTKTNIINIFVINFKENNKQVGGTTGGQKQEVQTNTGLSPFRIDIKPSKPAYHKPTFPFHPYNSRPHSLFETTKLGSTLSESPLATLVDHSVAFNSKMGLAADAEDDENEGIVGMSSEKTYQPNDHIGMDQFEPSNSDKINIFDLLPGDIGAITAVQYAPGVGTDTADAGDEHNGTVQTMESHNNANKVQNISYLPMLDNLNFTNSHQPEINSDHVVNKIPFMTTASYGDYFADFLPDRSRDPPGSENPHPPQEPGNINEHNILAILTSPKKPATNLSAASISPAQGSNVSGDEHDTALPPALAHLEWIFKNQPPPKPQISLQPDTTIVKRKGEMNNEGNNDSDSMMEPDETSNTHPPFYGSTTQELVDFLLKLQNSSKVNFPLDSNFVSENATLLSAYEEPQINTNQTQRNTTVSQDSEIGTVMHASSQKNQTVKVPTVEYTTKVPAFWKFGNKLPIGALSAVSTINSEEALNNRLRKLITAFGYSALPTIAAGAAATWPYWVPLVATGRRRRRRSTGIAGHEGELDIKQRGHQFLNDLLTSATTHHHNNMPDLAESSAVSSGIVPSDRQLLSKSTKNSRRDGASGEHKWIKVDVITATAKPLSTVPSSSPSPIYLSSSPTSLDFGEMNGHSEKNRTSFHSPSENNSFRLKTNHTLHNGNSNHEQKLSQNSNNGLKNDEHDSLQEKTTAQEKHDRVGLSAEQQLDVPLLKNFLKNVLYNELNLSNKNTPAPYVYASSSTSPHSNDSPIKYQVPPVKPLSFFSSTTLSPQQFLSSTSSPQANKPTVMSQIATITPAFNKLITKHGHHYIKAPAQQHQPVVNANKVNVPLVLNTPLSRPPLSTSAPSLLLFPEQSQVENKYHAENERVIVGSDTKVVSISAFSTPSPSSVYIHNRGDGTTSIVTTKAPSSSASLVHRWQNNGPWGSSLSSGTTETTSAPDKISSSSTVTTSFSSPGAPGHSHYSDMTHHHHHHHQQHIHSASLSAGQTFNDANSHLSSNSVDYFLNQFHHSNKRLQKNKLADSILASESITTKTDMTNNVKRTIDIDSNQQPRRQRHVMETSNQRTTMAVADSTAYNSKDSFPPVRSQRRLHKWSDDKTDELNSAAEDDDDDDNNMSDTEHDENGPLVQSLSAMASHLMNTKHGENDNFENSSERDVYITEKGHGVTVPSDDQESEEETASEEDSTDSDIQGERKRGNGGEINDVGGEDDNDDDNISPKLKSDHYSTTPKGLTTWSAVNGHTQSSMYTSKATMQKTRPVEYTISSVLSFSTERPQTTQEMMVIKERETTTEPSTKITSKVNLMSPSGSSSSSNNSKNKRRPYTNNKNRKVLPSKFVKPQLEEVTAEVASIDETHVVLKTKVTTEAPEMKSTGVTDYYDRFTTRKPLWPYQMTTRRVPTKRPAAFSRVTAKPKHPYANKKPQGSSIYAMTSPTTTTPSTTTTYTRNPQTFSPMTGLTVSLADIPFMDFLRSQIIPRIGLTLISFMASTPLLLSLFGAGLRRKKRSLEPVAQFSSFSGKALFEDTKRRSALPQNDQFDFSAIQKKLEDALMKYPTRKRVGHGSANSATNSFDIFTEAFKQLARWWSTKSSPPLSRTYDNGWK